MKRKTGRRLALLAAGGLLLAQGSALAQSSDPLRVTKPVHATKDDLDPQRTYAAPALAVSPSDPKIILGGTIEFRTKQCKLMRSMDGGATWKFLENPPVLPTYPFCLANNSNIFHAPVAFGRNNTVYVATSGWDFQDTRSKVSLVVFRSTNLGDSWTSVVARDARPTADADQINTRPVTGLVVDSKSGSDDIVYVSYREALANRAAPNGAPQQPMVVTSTDGGRTFGPPVSARGQVFDAAGVRDAALSARTTTTPAPNATTTTAPAEGSLAANPNQAVNFGATGNGQGLTVDDDGNLYYTWMSGSANISPSPPSALIVSKSTDQGKTWDAVLARPFTYQNRQNPRIAWSDHGGGDGTLHVVYEGSDDPTINSFAEVKYISSTDGGKTWTDPKRLADDDPKLLNGKYLPEIKVAPNGRVDVVWWDTRDDPGIRANDVYYTYSEDGGKTWAKNIRMTDQTIDRRFGVWGNNYDQNSPVSLASVNQYAIVGWDDTRFSRGEEGAIVPANPVDDAGIGSGIQDIFVSTVQFTAIGGGTSNAAKVVLAGVVGLLAVGLILLVVAMSSRRRAGAPPSPKTPKKAPAKVT